MLLNLKNSMTDKIFNTISSLSSYQGRLFHCCVWNEQRNNPLFAEEYIEEEHEGEVVMDDQELKSESPTHRIQDRLQYLESLCISKPSVVDAENEEFQAATSESFNSTPTTSNNNRHQRRSSLVRDQVSVMKQSDPAKLLVSTEEFDQMIDKASPRSKESLMQFRLNIDKLQSALMTRHTTALPHPPTRVANANANASSNGPVHGKSTLTLEATPVSVTTCDKEAQVEASCHGRSSSSSTANTSASDLNISLTTLEASLDKVEESRPAQDVSMCSVAADNDPNMSIRGFRRSAANRSDRRDPRRQRLLHVITVDPLLRKQESQSSGCLIM